MKILNCKQGSDEWLQARCGIPTASQFGRIMGSKRTLLAGSATYRNELLAEWLCGQPLETPASQFMARGTALEAKARADYAFNQDADLVQVGFILRDDGATGCSPDALVGTDGLLEIKCLSLVNHVGAMLDADEDYMQQVQGQMWIAERAWCDRLYFHPILPPVIKRIERDEKYIADLSKCVDLFIAGLAEAKDRLRAAGCVPPDEFVSKVSEPEPCTIEELFDAHP